METEMIEESKEFFQSWLAPQREGIKGDIRALDAKIEAKAETTRIRGLIPFSPDRLRRFQGRKFSPRIAVRNSS